MTDEEAARRRAAAARLSTPMTFLLIRNAAGEIIDPPPGPERERALKTERAWQQFYDGDRSGLDVEALRVRVAVGPGLDVARAQELGHVEAGDCATAVPVHEQAAAEDVLADPPDLPAVGFRRPRQVRGLAVKIMKQGVRGRARELERTAEQAME